MVNERTERRALHWLLGLLSVAFAGCAGGAPAAPSGRGDAGPDAGSVRCSGTLSGLVGLPDAGFAELQDAGFDCVVALLADDAGARATITLHAEGALPDPATSVGAVVIVDGGQPDAAFHFGNQIFSASASVEVADGRAFSLQRGVPGTQQGAATLVLDSISDGGPGQNGFVVLTGHGTLDATLPYLFGVRPDAGFDAGDAVLLHATF